MDDGELNNKDVFIVESVEKNGDDHGEDGNVMI